MFINNLKNYIKKLKEMIIKVELLCKAFLSQIKCLIYKDKYFVS
jgi:hypothetical protein